MILGITLGDAAGIGPEISVKALNRCDGNFVVYGSKIIIDGICKKFSMKNPIQKWFPKLPEKWEERIIGIDAGFFDEIPESGKVSKICGQSAFNWVTAAANDALAGKISGIVTAPLNKEAMHIAGIHFPGHTELLTEICEKKFNKKLSPCMAFYSPNLILSLVTIHLAIKDVPENITKEQLTNVINLTADAVKLLKHKVAKIGVLALNPHAGEAGAFGHEETEIISPVINSLKNDTMELTGPLVPDTEFTWMMQNKPPSVDAYVAMYHDQGLIPFKTMAFDCGVNMTLGLPLVRTSPDHGTAFNIAWQGTASENSMFEAIECAKKLIGK